MSINRVNISGFLTRDCELRTLPNGSSVLNFGIAVNDRRKNASGDWEDVPNFVDCVVFGARADGLSKVLAKGMKVAIDGKLRYSSWEKDGQRRSKLEVMVEDLELMSRQSDGEAARGPQQPQAAQYTHPYQSGPQNVPQQPQAAQYGVPSYYDSPF